MISNYQLFFIAVLVFVSIILPFILTVLKFKFIMMLFIIGMLWLSLSCSFIETYYKISIFECINSIISVHLFFILCMFIFGSVVFIVDHIMIVKMRSLISNILLKLFIREDLIMYKDFFIDINKNKLSYRSFESKLSLFYPLNESSKLFILLYKSLQANIDVDIIFIIELINKFKKGIPFIKYVYNLIDTMYAMFCIERNLNAPYFLSVILKSEFNIQNYMTLLLTQGKISYSFFVYYLNLSNVIYSSTAIVILKHQKYIDKFLFNKLKRMILEKGDKDLFYYIDFDKCCINTDICLLDKNFYSKLRKINLFSNIYFWEEFFKSKGNLDKGYVDYWCDVLLIKLSKYKCIYCGVYLSSMDDMCPSCFSIGVENIKKVFLLISNV